MRSRVLVGVLGALAAVAVACSGGAETCSAQTAKLLPAGDDPFLAGYPRYEDEAAGLRIILGTPDLGVGRHRVGFVLSDVDGLIRLPVVQVVSYFYPAGADGQREGPVQNGLARFFAFPYGVRGMFSLELEFDRAGTWGLEVLVPRPDGTTLQISFAFPVAERTRAPAVGDPAPRSESRTAADVASLNELTTGYELDPALYRMSLAEAVGEGRPLVVVFASPAFCTNALCGPQVEVLSELASLYRERANFIHVDLYENPHEIKGDLDRAVRTPILEEWGLETDEWTFVVDGDGVVAARFEAFVTRVELEEALLRVLGGGDSTARRD
jgi:hypothetical protein